MNKDRDFRAFPSALLGKRKCEFLQKTGAIVKNTLKKVGAFVKITPKNTCAFGKI